MTGKIVLSYVQVKPLLKYRRAGAGKARVSPDLGLTMVEVDVTASGLLFPQGQRLDWESAEQISAEESGCFVLEDDSPEKIVFFSEETGRVYSLYPTGGAPTMLISGIPMHRIKGTDPHQDTLEKMKTLKPLSGQVLDTATGLGYTAIEASRTAEHVTTIELDPAALEVARLNPWSSELFDNPRITQWIGDSFELIEQCTGSSFSAVIHDPPAFALAGDLYSTEFYKQLYRVLKPRGRVFHYIGNPESKTGHNVTSGVMRRLQQAGFTRVIEQPRAFGILAFKS